MVTFIDNKGESVAINSHHVTRVKKDNNNEDCCMIDVSNGDRFAVKGDYGQIVSKIIQGQAVYAYTKEDQTSIMY